MLERLIHLPIVMALAPFFALLTGILVARTLISKRTAGWFMTTGFMLIVNGILFFKDGLILGGVFAGCCALSGVVFITIGMTRIR